MTVVSMLSRKTSSIKNISQQSRTMKHSTTALQISILCNIVLSCIIAILLFQQVSLNDNKESAKGRLLVVAYTDRADTTRLISARPVTRKERKAYESDL